MAGRDVAGRGVAGRGWQGGVWKGGVWQGECGRKAYDREEYDKEMALCAPVCILCVCAGTLDCSNIQLCFSNANLTRGLCVAATARPTSTTVSCIETPASLDPKSRWTTMDTAKVRHGGTGRQSSVAGIPGVLSTLTTATEAVATTQVLGGLASWHP